MRNNYFFEMGGYKMRRAFFLLVILSVVSISGFSQFGTDIFVGYLWGLNPITTAGSITSVGGEDIVPQMVNAGFLIDYEIADGFSIGGGIGGAFQLAKPLAFESTITPDATVHSPFLVDGLIGISYFYPLQPVLLKVNVLGGVSFFNFEGFDNLGYLIKAKFGVGFDLGGMVLSIGAGYELRTYNLVTREEGNPDAKERGSITIHSIPIELGITVRF